MNWLVMVIRDNKPAVMRTFHTRAEAQTYANDYLEEYFPGAPHFDDELFDAPEHTEEHADVLLECSEISIGVYDLENAAKDRDRNWADDDEDDEDDEDDDDIFDFEDDE